MPTVTPTCAVLTSPGTALPILPVSVSSFKRLRTGRMLYVDKTELICRLARLSGKFFFIRPRRFGKSLLVSTLACLFEGGTQYFSGLAAERLWRDKTYTLVRIDFSEAKNFLSFEQFAKQMRDTLTTAFEPAGFFPNPKSQLGFFPQLSTWLEKQAPPFARLVNRRIRCADNRLSLKVRTL